MKSRKFTRRDYEKAALVATRETRQLVLYWARRCRKSTTLGAIAFDELSGERGRTVIAASASLLLGTELVGMTLSATEQAAIVTNEAAAVRQVMAMGADERALDFQCADMTTGKILKGLTEEDFADLYKSSKLELRLYFDRTTYSRLKIIAPNPATARGWAGTVLRDEAGYTPAGLENELRIATKPITDTDPTFKIIYASNLSRDDRHPFFEMTMPPADLELPVNPLGNFFRGQTGVTVHRVTLADAYAAGHVLFDDKGQPLTYDEFCARPENKLGLDESYRLIHKSGGSAAIDLIALMSAQARGARSCAFAFAENDWEFSAAMDKLAGLLGSGPVGVGFDVATTTGDKSNPSAITITEKNGIERAQRLVVCWKERKPQVVRERLGRILDVIEARREGGRARRMAIDATSERYFAEETADRFRDRVPVDLIVSSAGIHPPGYEQATIYKTFLGDLYSNAINDNHYSLPADPYIKRDQRLVVKDGGRYACEPEADGAHGDTFDSGKLAEWALVSQGGSYTAEVI